MLEAEAELSLDDKPAAKDIMASEPVRKMKDWLVPDPVFLKPRTEQQAKMKATR